MSNLCSINYPTKRLQMLNDNLLKSRVMEDRGRITMLSLMLMKVNKRHNRNNSLTKKKVRIRKLIRSKHKVMNAHFSKTM